MGLKKEYLSFIDNYTYPGMKMCEYGNQILKGNKYRTAKEYFESKGIIHTSIDINGKDGALPIDLSKPIIRENFLYSFDIVTNSGTSEHIEDQYGCFGNIHNLCKKDGIMIHIAPRKNYGKNHGFYKYEYKFFEELAEYNDYSIIKHIDSFYGGRKRKKYLCAVSIRKDKDNEFIDMSTFYKINGLYNE